VSRAHHIKYFRGIRTHRVHTAGYVLYLARGGNERAMRVVLLLGIGCASAAVMRPQLPEDSNSSGAQARQLLLLGLLSGGAGSIAPTASGCPQGTFNQTGSCAVCTVCNIFEYEVSPCVASNNTVCVAGCGRRVANPTQQGSVTYGVLHTAAEPFSTILGPNATHLVGVGLGALVVPMTNTLLLASRDGAADTVRNVVLQHELSTGRGGAFLGGVTAGVPAAGAAPWSANISSVADMALRPSGARELRGDLLVAEANVSLAADGLSNLTDTRIWSTAVNDTAQLSLLLELPADAGATVLGIAATWDTRGALPGIEAGRELLWLLLRNQTTGALELQALPFPSQPPAAGGGAWVPDAAASLQRVSVMDANATSGVLTAVSHYNLLSTDGFHSDAGRDVWFFRHKVYYALNFASGAQVRATASVAVGIMWCADVLVAAAQCLSCGHRFPASHPAPSYPTSLPHFSAQTHRFTTRALVNTSEISPTAPAPSFILTPSCLPARRFSSITSRSGRAPPSRLPHPPCWQGARVPSPRRRLTSATVGPLQA